MSEPTGWLCSVRQAMQCLVRDEERAEYMLEEGIFFFKKMKVRREQVKPAYMPGIYNQENN